MTRKYTLITGASSGMGEATAKLLSRDRNLIISGRDTERLKAVAEICRQNGNDILLFPFDLEKADVIARELTAFIKEKSLAVEAFAHFAGMTEVLSVKRTNYKIGLKVMNVNYFSAVEIISTLTKNRVNSDNLKKIVLVSSIMTYTSGRYQPHYVASKGAIETLAIALACELAPINVNVISPGSFNTRIMQTLFKDNSPDAPWNPPTLLSPGTVDEVANVAKFLLSEESRYITGQIVYVDGGERFA